MKKLIQEPIPQQIGVGHSFFTFFVDFWLPWGTLKRHRKQKQLKQAVSPFEGLPPKGDFVIFDVFFMPLAGPGPIPAPFWHHVGSIFA